LLIQLSESGDVDRSMNQLNQSKKMKRCMIVWSKLDQMMIQIIW